MKRFFCLPIILALWVGSSGRATTLSTGDSVQQSLRTGSARQLATYFDKSIELIIDSEDIEFPSVQATHAEFILKSFFRKYPPRRFQYVYQGHAAHRRYSTGTYQTGRETFQVYVLMRETTARTDRNVNPGPSQYRISTLHFRKITE
ncbi:MAG: DUF4783 domain-containing protein [Bacteroidetes bacterium]|nr:DUF4783 domain-containing protein [Fibrella sp.]